MDDIDNRSIEQVNKVNNELREEWEEWNARVRDWKRVIDQLEEENAQLHKLVRGTSGPKRGYYEESFRDRGTEKWEKKNKKYYME